MKDSGSTIKPIAILGQGLRIFVFIVFPELYIGPGGGGKVSLGLVAYYSFGLFGWKVIPGFTGY
jgi:hypothetical protein